MTVVRDEVKIYGHPIFFDPSIAKEYVELLEESKRCSESIATLESDITSYNATLHDARRELLSILNEEAALKAKADDLRKTVNTNKTHLVSTKNRVEHTKESYEQLQEKLNIMANKVWYVSCS